MKRRSIIFGLLLAAFLSAPFLGCITIREDRRDDHGRAIDRPDHDRDHRDDRRR